MKEFQGAWEYADETLRAIALLADGWRSGRFPADKMMEGVCELVDEYEAAKSDDTQP